MSMAQPDQIEDLPAVLGAHLMEHHTAEETSGHLEMVGWVGLFDTRQLTGMFAGLNIVIVAAWPPQDDEIILQVEGFSSPAIAGWRFLVWDEMFRMSPIPDENDIVIWRDNAKEAFVLSGIRVRKWARLEAFLKGKVAKKRKLWFYDHEIGNYYLWEL